MGDDVQTVQLRGNIVAVRMFGPLELRANESRLGPGAFGGVKPKQLLEVLLVERDRPVPKDRIADLLWGDRLPARYVRLASYPWMARRLAEMNAELDVRSSLARIRAPTLVICRTDDAWLSPENSRYLAEHIADAELLELPGVDHDPWVGDTEPVLDAVETFLSRLGRAAPGNRSAPAEA